MNASREELRDAVRENLAAVRAAGGRLARGTGLLLESPAVWFDVPTMGALLVRIAVPVGVLAFAGPLLARAPQFIYAVPAVWVTAAWRLSDSSATPPPLPDPPPGDEYAGQIVRVDRVERGPEGVMCTIHVVREEVNGP
ncbi:hypothetical protein ACIA8H_31385 [Streptomyces goshikiensis]|uniref:hypothetical protein n=1 Tax=Streptomyces goshikiensis TaxID=1942 RepID=UPI0037B069B9